MAFESKQEHQQIAYIDNLPNTLKESLMWYTGPSYIAFNKALREDAVSSIEHKKYMKNIDLVFSGAPPLTESMIVYRGVRFSGRISVDNDDFLEIDNAYVSTTKDMKQTSLFSGEKCCVLQITISAGTKVLFLKKISMHEDEDEILLDRGGKFIITGTEIRKGMKIVYMTYIPKGSLLVKSVSEVKKAVEKFDEKLIQQRIVEYILKYKSSVPEEELEDEIELVSKRLEKNFSLTSDMIKAMIIQISSLRKTSLV